MTTTPTATPTAAEFLAQTDPEDGPQVPDPWGSPLESIALSLASIAEVLKLQHTAEDRVEAAPSRRAAPLNGEQ